MQTIKLPRLTRHKSKHPFFVDLVSETWIYLYMYYYNKYLFCLLKKCLHINHTTLRFSLINSYMSDEINKIHVFKNTYTPLWQCRKKLTSVLIGFNGTFCKVYPFTQKCTPYFRNIESKFYDIVSITFGCSME